MKKNRTPPPYHQLARASVDFWKNVGSKQTEDYKRVASADKAALGFFYIGQVSEAQEISYLYSQDQAIMAMRNEGSMNELSFLFFAALYRSLAMRKEESRMLWEHLVNAHAILTDEAYLERKYANAFVQLAYGLAKLGRYAEVVGPATKGFNALFKNLGIMDAPRENTREYLLVEVLKALASFRSKPSEELKEQAQNALARYKEENYKISRLGYPVIFDLQFSYPDVFDTVLPGPDPEKD